MLPEKDRREYKKGIYDLYEEIGTPIKYFPLNLKNSNINIYNEVESEKEYGKEVKLVATVVVNMISQDENQPVKQQSEELYDVDVPILALENNKLDPKLMLGGKFLYKDITLNILDFRREGMFTDFFTTVKFRCEVE